MVVILDTLGENKKGISSFVATSLLVGLTILVIGIIIFWGRDIQEEQAEKSAALANTQLKCQSTHIDLEIILNGIRIVNTGRETFWGLIIREEFGELTRLNQISVRVDPANFFDLVYGGECTDQSSAPELGLCSNDNNKITIIAAQQEQGYRNAPFVACELTQKTFRVS